MGEAAEMMLDGTLDYVTGEYLGEPCGYPRSRTDGTFHPNRHKLQLRAKRSIRDLCKNTLKETDHTTVDHIVRLYMEYIGLARIPKKAAQYEMVFLHHKADFRQFLTILQQEIDND